MKRTRATTAALLVGSTLLLAGCGGGGSDEASSQQAPAAEAGGDMLSGLGLGNDEAAAQVPAAEAAGAAAAPATEAAGGAEAAAEAPAAASATAGGATKAAAKATKAAAGEAAGAGGQADKTINGRMSAKIAEGAGKTAFKTAATPTSALANRDLIYTADMTVQTQDVEKAASQIESAADAAGGIVVNSTRSSEPGGETVDEEGNVVKLPDRSSATIKLRVPPGDFDDVLARIAKTGKVLDRTLTGKDVTAEVVDVNSRISSQRKSVARVRDLMDKAVTLRDIVSLESEVAQREAELEALLAKQAKLKDQTALATITVRIVPEPLKDAPVVRTDDTDQAGFASGLHDGWDAFTAALVVAATVLGALLPFAVALLVLAPPVAWFVIRVRRAGKREESTAAS